MKYEKTAILAVFISLTAHSVFFAVSPYVDLKGMRQVRGGVRKMFRITDVRKTDGNVALFEEPKENVTAVKISKKSSSLGDDAFQDMFVEEKIKKDISLEAKKEKMKKEKISEISPLDRQQQDIEDVLKVESNASQKDVSSSKRTLRGEGMDKAAVSQTVLSGSSSRRMDYAGGEMRPESLEPTRDIWRPASSSVFKPGKDEIAATKEKTRVGEYEDISRYLDVEIFTYTDPASNEKYFKLIITAKEESSFKVFPKEIIFLIDSSKSITEEKLSYMKDGVSAALGSFNPDDRFNIIAFRGDLVRFKKDSVNPAKETIKEARSFIKKLNAIGQTDVEGALLDIIREPPGMKPSYVVLITDGRPTTGVIDSRRIIQQITRNNGMERPIFCFGGGRKVNKYLLDFIAHQNRAWSRFAATSYEMERQFNEFYNEIKDPVLLNVRYRVKGIDPDEIYPKYLPDFYRGKSFVVYGRFNDEDIFSMQILGEIEGKTKELIFKRSLADASIGGEDIASEWAFSKVYYLISRNTMGIGDIDKLREEIDGLSREYGIITPYDIQDRD